MAIKKLAGGKVAVTPDDLPRAIAALVGETPGDWARNLSTGGGYMRRKDGRIGTLSDAVVALLDKAQERSVRERSPEASRQMRLAVLERISR